MPACRLGRVGGSDRGLLSVEKAAAVGLVAALMAGVFAVGTPERVACAVRFGMAAVSSSAGTGTGVGGDAECRGEQVAEVSAASTGREGARPAAELAGRTFGAEGMGGLGQLSATSRDLLGRVSPDQRCAVPPGGFSQPSVLCLRSSDGTSSGDEILDRCWAGEEAGALLCSGTGEDPRSALDTSRSAGLTAWCQPVRVDASGAGPASVEWACSSWAGDVFFCPGEVEREVVSSRARDGKQYELAGWTKERGSWPPTCGSRTLGDRSWAGCGAVTAASSVGCTVPARDGAPERALTCVEFTGTAEQAASSHVINKPLHCRVLPEAPDQLVSAPPAVVGGEGDINAPAALGCPAQGGRAQHDELRRRSLKASLVMPNALVARAMAFCGDFLQHVVNDGFPVDTWAPPVLEMQLVGDDVVHATELNPSGDLALDGIVTEVADAVEQNPLTANGEDALPPIIAVMPPGPVDPANGTIELDLWLGQIGLAVSSHGLPNLVVMSSEAAHGELAPAWSHAAVALSSWAQAHPGQALDQTAIANSLAQAWFQLDVPLPPLPAVLQLEVQTQQIVLANAAAAAQVGAVCPDAVWCG